MPRVETIKGLKELRQTCRSIDRGLNRELTRTLKSVVAEPVANIARSLAPFGPSHGAGGAAGGLRSSIRSGVSGGAVSIRSSPPLNPTARTQRGYAAVYEYGGRGGAETRAFLHPAVRQFVQSGGLQRAGDEVLDWVSREWKHD